MKLATPTIFKSSSHELKVWKVSDPKVMLKPEFAKKKSLRFKRPCLVPLWTCKVKYGPLRSCKVPFCPLWLHMVQNVPVWSHIVPYGLIIMVLTMVRWKCFMDVSMFPCDVPVCFWEGVSRMFLSIPWGCFKGVLMILLRMFSMVS